jgi:hypothetical protein
MATVAIIIGVLLTLVGGSFYGGIYLFQDRAPSATALIPAIAGLPILVLGLVALIDKYRPHAMHAVSLLALLGVLLPVGRLMMKIGQGEQVTLTAFSSLFLMAFLCGILLAACVKSFIDARRRRSGQ